MYEYNHKLDHAKGVCDLSIYELGAQEDGQYKRFPDKTSYLEKIRKACVPGNIQ
jgi:hypothetical protein